MKTLSIKIYCQKFLFAYQYKGIKTIHFKMKNSNTLNFYSAYSTGYITFSENGTDDIAAKEIFIHVSNTIQISHLHSYLQRN